MNSPAYVKHPRLIAWVNEMVALCKPDQVYWCDGSEEEYQRLCQQLVDAGTFKKLNPAKRPNSFLACSDPSDVARVEDRTYICSEKKEEAGPTNNWMAPAEMRDTLQPLFDGCMKGRTMYVVPFQHGTAGLAHRPHRRRIVRQRLRGGEQRIMTRMGKAVSMCWAKTATSYPAFTPSVRRWPPGRKTCPGPATAPNTSSTTRNPRNLVYGSGYGGNALLGKKCFALRIASTWDATRAGWPSTCSSWA
jgi:phosphoenolpyruvate carboxykinase (GTP)